MAGGGANMEQFEAYFRRADLDGDGRISGAEAVAFFKGSNLPQPVLAQIWTHADQSRSGYLSRPEFYNALKLVTVAQSKRDLTPDIVKAALYGSASTKIPAPQINLAAITAPQVNSVGSAVPAHPMGAGVPTASQNVGIRGQLPPTTGMNQQYLTSQASQSVRPPIPTAATASRPQQSFAGLDFPRGGSVIGPGLPNSNISNDYLGGRQAAITPGPTMQHPNIGTNPSIRPVAQNLQGSLSLPSLTAANSKVTGSSGNGFSSESMFGGETFSAAQSVPKKSLSTPNLTATSAPTTSATVPVTSGSQTSAKPDPFAVFQSTFTRQSPGIQQQATSSVSKPNQQVSGQNILPASSGTPVGSVQPTPEQSEVPWPKITRTGVQRYAKVFMEVDSDRDGKISGQQARDLFFYWRLPREVLKQVWDLADQDNDSMLSLREFCVALYLMERYKEGRSLPTTLPNSVMLDETLLALAGPPTVPYGSTGWAAASGLRPPQGLGVQPVAHPGVGPPMQGAFPQPDQSLQFNQQNARATSMDNSHMDQLSNGDQNMLELKGEDSVAGEKKDESKENVLLDSKEKLEFYRTKMQDLVLYKSRCDNRLNEITERALADKREAELLAKKYEEKYKQVAEIASKLTIEEASFRDTQERKLELQQAIVKMEQGGSTDGILQVRADRIQHDLEELLKALADRCKKHELNMESTALIELPPGWQPGIPEISAVWDEDWDKFEDEGFSFDVAVPANSKPTATEKKTSSANGDSLDSVSNSDAKSENLPIIKENNHIETDLMYMHSDEESKSPQGSPRERTAFDSPSGEYSDKGELETNRFSEPGWGTFDNNDDVDSVWGFNAKESDHVKHGEKLFFESTDFGASPVRTESPGAESRYQKNSLFTYEDSIPGSPPSKAGNSPRYSVGSKDPFFDSFSRYDSFSTHDRGSSPQRETFSRFDSMSSVSGDQRKETFSRFDSMSSVSGDPRRETLTRFDSISSTGGFDHSRGYSFDDADPFGSSGPFKVSSSENQNQKKSSDHWSSF